MGFIGESIEELKKFGLKEILVHLASKAGLANPYSYYKCRIPYLESLSEEGRRTELSAWYKARMGVLPDLDNPATLTQWIQWSKLYAMDAHKTMLADKYAVRDWVSEQIGEQYLIPLLGVWEHASQISWDKLPDRFVLKANHGTGMTVIVKDKNSIDKKKAGKKLDLWLSAPFGWNGFELQYTPIDRKIVAEQYIVQKDGDLLDYKIHCFNGKPVMFQLIGGRTGKAHGGVEASYDCQWNRWIIPRTTYGVYEKGFAKPDNLDEMIHIAEVLCRDFPYVRVDLYNIEGKVYFGEMTFTPANGLNRWFDEVFEPQYLQLKQYCMPRQN